MESLYEYGSRAGVWRLLREFERRSLPLTVFGVAMALERNPDATAAFVALGHEIACHGLRWIHYQGVDPGTEAAHMRRAVEIIDAPCVVPVNVHLCISLLHVDPQRSDVVPVAPAASARRGRR